MHDEVGILLTIGIIVIMFPFFINMLVEWIEDKEIEESHEKYKKSREEDEELARRYRNSYIIDFKNQKIFDLNDKKIRNASYFKKSDEKDPTLENIKERIANEYYRKQILIDSKNHDVQYLVNIGDFEKFFLLSEIYFDKKKCSISYVYLSNINNSENEIFYKLNTYPTNSFHKELEKVKTHPDYKNVKIIDQSELSD